jgi:hypothetical protein
MTIDNAERFERLLAALERELIEATDEEVLAAASDLGMNPAMKGSAAFFGITIALRTQSEQIYGIPPMDGLPVGRRRPKDDPSS